MIFNAKSQFSQLRKPEPEADVQHPRNQFLLQKSFLLKR